MAHMKACCMSWQGLWLVRELCRGPFVRLKHASMVCLASGTGSTKVSIGGGGGGHRVFYRNYIGALNIEKKSIRW